MASSAFSQWRQRHNLFDDKSRYLDRFGLVLTLTVLLLALLSLLDIFGQYRHPGTLWGGLLLEIVSAGLLLVALMASGTRRGWLRFFAIFSIVVIVIDLSQILYFVTHTESSAENNEVLHRTPPVAPAIFSFLMFVAVLLRVFRHKEVQLATLLGSLTAFLMIPMTFFYVFLMVDVVAGPFFPHYEPSQDFMYFSLTNVTTVGSELVPATESGPTPHLNIRPCRPTVPDHVRRHDRRADVVATQLQPGAS